MTRDSNGLAAYFAANCNCRRGWMCQFCGHSLTPHKPTRTVRPRLCDVTPRCEH